IRDLSKEPARALRRPTLWRFAAAAAAVLVVGLIGAIAQAISTEGGLPFAATTRIRTAGIPKQRETVPLFLEGLTSSGEIGSALVAEFEKEITEGKLKASDVIEFAQSAQKIQESGYGEKVAEDSGKPGDKKAPAPSGLSNVPTGDFRRIYDGYDKSMLKF